MSRIYFTDLTLSQLKTTLTNSIYILNSLAWQELSHKIYDDFGEFPDQEKVMAAIPVEPFKPHRTSFYNSVATLLGYKNWKELTTVSNEENLERIAPIFVSSNEELRAGFKSIYINAFRKQYNPSEAGGLKAYFEEMINFYCGLVSDAIVLNPINDVDNSHEIAVAENTVNIGLNSCRTPSGTVSFSRELLYPTDFPIPNLVSEELDEENGAFHDFFDEIISSNLEHLSMLAKHMLFSQTLNGGYVITNRHIPSQHNFSSQYKILEGVIKLGVVLQTFAHLKNSELSELMPHMLKPTSKKELQDDIFMLNIKKSE
ncbi:hypothetical protein DZF79_29025 [Vibrio parahaemolyticus]|nr:hypothetical protein [Vibrio parahaemolyticus]